MQQRLLRMVRTFRLQVEPQYIEIGSEPPREETVARYTAMFGEPVREGHRKQTERFLRWREVMLEHSSEAEIIFWYTFIAFLIANCSP